MRDFPRTLRTIGPDANGGFRSYLLDNNVIGLTHAHPNSDGYYPGVANQWAVGKDGRTVYFRLDPNARFSDGNLVKASDYFFFFYFMRSKHIQAPWYNDYYGEPVLSVITERLPVSTYFGLLTFLITYIICIPLGVFKAVRHNTLPDDISSILIFVGYAVPGYALGSLLLLFFSVKLDWLPMRGLTSSGFSELSPWEQIKDLVIHTFQPLCCYLIGGFAFVTMLMKNHLMDNLASDYVRTAMAKGVSFGIAVRKHALRNSLVPLATNVGHQVTLFVTGSFLIETIFDIDGFGLLGFNSVIDRDYPVVMGILTLSATLMLLGNVLSDALVALVDPRVRFE